MKPRKVPMRMCVGCREMKPKKELIRIVRNEQGFALIDKTSKEPGRGAYICPNAICLEKAVKTRALERALEIKIDETVFTQLKEELPSIEQ